MTLLSVDNLFRAKAFEPIKETANRATTLPRECYISADFHEFELETVWRREWICVGHISQIPNVGDYFPTSIGSDPLVVVRSSEDRISVFSSVCRHRAMVIAAKPGNCNRLRCDYHGWQYDLAGQLVAAPAMGRTQGFNRSEVCLPRLAVDIWKGFIFTTFRPDPDPVGDALADLEPLIGPYDVERLSSLPPAGSVYSYNWKVYMENAMECYHCSYLHAGLHECTPSRNTQPERFPDHPAAVVVTVASTHPDASFVPPDYTVQFPPLPGLSLEERSQMHWIGILPNLLMGFYPDGVHYTILLPESGERTRMTFGWMYPPEVMARADFQPAYDHQEAVLAGILQQDFDACERVQRGLHATLAERGRLSWQEETFNHFDRWLVSRYQRAGA